MRGWSSQNHNMIEQKRKKIKKSKNEGWKLLKINNIDLFYGFSQSIVRHHSELKRCTLLEMALVVLGDQM